jgi:hypothetical protein
MICAFCSGPVQWQGPLSALTHTKCMTCGRTNCQRPEEPTAIDVDEIHVPDTKAPIMTESAHCEGHAYPVGHYPERHRPSDAELEAQNNGHYSRQGRGESRW